MASELGTYLKVRRAAVRPADVGLATLPGRRVPGLRREEVAMLAGVSVDYYARLEQGRERTPSPSVLNALARALLLDQDQRDHVFRLAGLAPETPDAPGEVTPSLRALLEAWPHTPAMILDRQWNIVAHNTLAAAFYSPFERIDNLARMILIDPAGRRFFVDRERAVEACVAGLKLARSHPEAAEGVQRLAHELSRANAQFAALWASTHEVRGKTHAVKAFRHDEVGSLVLDSHAFEVRGRAGLHLVVYHAAAGSSDEDKLRILSSLAAMARSGEG